jgi:hypothetical protein
MDDDLFASHDRKHQRTVVTRAEALAQYRPVRASIRHVLSAAADVCSRQDVTRALKQIAPWAEQEDLEDERIVEMLTDVALFEPNQRGRRAYDRFLAEEAGRFDVTDRALAENMAGAWFSLFRVAGPHEVAGTWLEDILVGNRRLWFMDEAFETCATEDLIIGMRLFDAGPFFAGFGIVVRPDEETVEVCLETKGRGDRLPFRQSLAATLYGDELQEKAPPSLADPALLATLLETFVSGPARGRSRPNDRQQPRPRKPPARRKG